MGGAESPHTYFGLAIGSRDPRHTETNFRVSIHTTHLFGGGLHHPRSLEALADEERALAGHVHGHEGLERLGPDGKDQMNDAS